MSNLQLSVKTRSFNIGIITRELVMGDKDAASDRIRAKLVAENSRTIEIWNKDTNYHSLIFHFFDFEYLEFHRKISVNGGLAVYDICDYTWVEDERVMRFANLVDIVTVASKPLKKRIIKDGCKKPVYVIGDGHNLKDRRKKWHKEKAEWVVWFGYIENFPCVAPYLETLKDNGLKLRIIAQRDNKRGDEFIEWDVNTYYDRINECDFSLLPKNGPYKTNNKIITSWLCGLPVARNNEDIVRFINKKNRLEHLRDVDYYKYSITKISKKYIKICAAYWASKEKKAKEKLKKKMKK